MSRLPLVLFTAFGAAAVAIPFSALAATGALQAGDGAARGNITVTAAPHGVILRVEATGLTPGWHGIHFHEKGECTGPAFQTAGGHVHTATPPVHGLLNLQANDDGDLPNIYAGADGTAHAELYSTLVTLNPGGAQPALLDADGAAVVIHANADDYTAQPIGGAGGRVACAVIR